MRRGGAKRRDPITVQLDAELRQQQPMVFCWVELVFGGWGGSGSLPPHHDDLQDRRQVHQVVQDFHDVRVLFGSVDELLQRHLTCRSETRRFQTQRPSVEAPDR